jgi:hypothetical protein
MFALARYLFPVLWSAAVAAHASESFASHCKTGEVVFLNAKMHPVESNKSERETGKEGPEKLLSLCSDRDTEPLLKLYYRFGVAGKAEIELVASSQKKAGIFRQFDSGSHAGLVTIRFYMKPYEYEVSEGMGMTSGIRLTVYKNRKRIAYFESHTEESQMVNIDFDRPSSPIFKLVNPIEPW